MRAELQLIAAADAALRAVRAREALRLLRRLERRCGQGFLREERRALQVVAACELGRAPEVAAERERVLGSAHGSVLSARIRDACRAPLAQDAR
jgi:hypothetical protein